MSKTLRIPIHLQQNRKNEPEGHVDLIYGPSMIHVGHRTPQKCYDFAHVVALRSNLFSGGDFHCFRAVGESGRSHMAPPPAPTWLPQNPRPPRNPRPPPAPRSRGVAVSDAAVESAEPLLNLFR